MTTKGGGRRRGGRRKRRQSSGDTGVGDDNNDDTAIVANNNDEVDEEAVHEEDRLIRVPQLQQQENGKYITSHAQHEEEIRRLHTVVVSREQAQLHNLPFVCHSHNEASCHNPFDKTFCINPYSTLVSPEILHDYYQHVDITVPKVRASDLSPKVLSNYDRLNRLDDQLFLRAIPEHELQARRDRETQLRAVEEAATMSPVQKTRIDEMNAADIYAWLAHRVQHQEASLMDVAKTLSRINSPIQGATNRFIKIIVCGGSGLGKSTVCTEIGRLCGLQKNRDRCFIELNFNTCQEKGHANMIVGSPPSYIGHDDENLVDRLLSAQEEIEFREEQEAGELAEDDEVMQVEKPPPRKRVIMVHIEEMDKGSLEMFVALNGFLESGTLTSIKGRVFTLPANVFLVLCASSNFAADYFNGLSEEQCGMRDIGDARKAIREAMQRKGLQDCDVTRLGRCTPFFPIVYKQAHDIMRRKLREFIARGGNCMESIRCAMHMDEEQQEAFIDYLMQGHYCRQDGIRPLENVMREELEDNASTQREFIDRYLEEALPRPLAQRPVLRFEYIRYREGLTLEKLLAHDACMSRRDQSDIFIDARLQSCLDQRCDIAYFVLEHADFAEHRNGIHVLTPMKRIASALTRTPSPPSSPVMVVVQQPVENARFLASGSADEAEAEKEGEKENEEAMDEIIDEKEPLLDPASPLPLPVEENPVETKKKRTLIVDTTQKNKRKRTKQPVSISETNSGDDDDTDTTSASSTTGDKQGRKKQKRQHEEFDGFVREGVVNKHTMYRCATCDSLVDKRRLAKHPDKCKGGGSVKTGHGKRGK